MPQIPIATPPRAFPRADPIAAILNIDAPALRGLMELRSEITTLLKKEKNRLKEALHATSFAVAEKQRRVNEEKDRIRFVNRKVLETREVNRKATEEHDRALEVLRTARASAHSVNSPDEKYSQTAYISNCESLVKSWAENLQVASESLSSWELKQKRQVVVVNRVSNELGAAEKKESETNTQITIKLTHLQAVADLLEDL